MTTLVDVTAIARKESFLAVVSTLRPDASIQSSVVNAGVIVHPVTGDDVVAFVTYGKAKLANLRVRPQISVIFRSGWQWATVEGEAELIGPESADGAEAAEPLRLLLRTIFVAAGGVHDDLDSYDRAMVEERRVAVLVKPERVYSN